MKKILLLTAVVSFVFADDVGIFVCGHTDDGAGNATFDICLNSDVDIAGFQFSFNPGGSGFTLSGGSGGLMAQYGFSVSTGSAIVLGFSMTGSVIPASDGEILTTVAGAYTTNGITTIGPFMNSGDTFASSGAQGIDVVTEETSWEAGNDSGLLDAGTTPAEYSLKAAYPNPFNPTTTIEYNVLEPGNVSIVVYDMMGREVKTLVNGFVSPSASGNYSVMWDGTNNANAFVATGIYVYRMIANDFVKTQKMTLTK